MTEAITSRQDLRPTIVVVTHQDPFSPVDGNRTRFAGLLQWFKQEGYRVSFRHVTSILTHDPLRQKLEIGARAFADKMFSPHVEFSGLAQAFEEAAGQFRVETAQ
jgi:hypothetical protein